MLGNNKSSNKFRHLYCVYKVICNGEKYVIIFPPKKRK